MPKTRPDPPTPRWLIRLAWVSVGLAVVVLFGLYPLIGGDGWMHLTVGRLIWQHGWVPITDPFSYVTVGQPFIAHSWLSEVAFYLIEARAGTIGFMLLRFGLIGLALIATLKTARLLNAPWPALMLLVPVTCGVMYGRMEFRPQLFTTAFLTFELWLLISVHTGHRSWPWLWVLPPLYALWINLHGGWTEGLGLLIVILVAQVVMALRDKYIQHAVNGLSHLPQVHLALVVVVCVGTLFVNPYGARLVSFPLEMQAGWIRAMGPEWQSPFALGWRVVGLYKPVLFGYMALVAGLLYTRLKRWRTADLVPMTVMSLWLALARWHLRAVSDMALLTSPFIAATLPVAGWRGKSWPMLIGSLLALGLVGIALWSAVDIWRTPRGFHWNRAEPICLAAAIERLNLSGHIFMKSHRQVDASWVLWRWFPQVQVDLTWEYVAGEEHVTAVQTIWKGGPVALQAYLDRYGVETVVSSTRLFWGRLAEDVLPGWAIVHLEDQWVIMVRQTAAQSMPIYHIIRPWTNAPVTSGNASQVLQEANRVLQQCPDGATFAWAYKGEALRLMGRYEESFDAQLKIPERLVIE